MHGQQNIKLRNYFRIIPERTSSKICTTWRGFLEMERHKHKGRYDKKTVASVWMKKGKEH
jgi:hypothetical protein